MEKRQKRNMRRRKEREERSMTGYNLIVPVLSKMPKDFMAIGLAFVSLIYKYMCKFENCTGVDLFLSCLFHQFATWNIRPLTYEFVTIFLSFQRIIIKKMAFLNITLLINQYFKYFKKRQNEFNTHQWSSNSVKIQPHIEIFFSSIT